jgi:hypothetical protein
MKNPLPCPEVKEIVIANVCLTIIASVAAIVALRYYYKYIDKQILKVVNKPESKNKITFKVLAVGFGAAYGIMMLPMAKETLDFMVYGIKIELHAVTKAIVFIGMITFGAITGGTQLSNIKGKQ